MEKKKTINKEPHIEWSEITNEIYIVIGRNKFCVTNQVINAMIDTGRLKESEEEE